MSKRKTRKEINAVILKYVGINNPDFIKFFAPYSVGLIAVGAGMDLLLTGGLFSIGTLLGGGTGSLVGAVAAGSLLSDNIRKSRANAAGQTLECTGFVNKTLEKMESMLQRSFKKASAKTARQKGKENFRALAAEIEEDLKKLSPAFKIVAGVPQDKYEFIVDLEDKLTLAQALRGLDQAPAPKRPAKPKKSALEEKVEALEKQIEELKNPKIVRLDKNPNNPPGP